MASHWSPSGGDGDPFIEALRSEALEAWELEEVVRFGGSRLDAFLAGGLREASALDRPGDTSSIRKRPTCYSAANKGERVGPREHPRAQGRTRLAKKPVGRSAWIFHVLVIKNQKIHV